MKISVDKILPVVRKTVLEIRTKQKYEYGAVGLSYITSLVASALNIPTWPGYSHVDYHRFTSGSPKTLRGPVQACLSKLAHEGILFGRNRPEPAVARYAHGETDKHFRFRISIDAAKARLRK